MQTQNCTVYIKCTELPPHIGKYAYSPTKKINQLIEKLWWFWFFCSSVLPKCA